LNLPFYIRGSGAPRTSGTGWLTTCTVAPVHRSAVTVAVVGLAGVVGLAWAARTRLAVGDWYPARASVVFAIVMLVAIARLRGNHPFARFGPANQITTARVTLVALVVGLIGEPVRPATAASAAAASGLVTLLDGVDGWLARLSGMASEFGARFDMEIDALLIMALAILAWQYDKAGPWVIMSGLLRYLFVGAGWLLPWLQDPLPSSRRRQAICVIQTTGLTLTILPVIVRPLSLLPASVALIALCYSFLVDTLWLWRHATRAPGSLAAHDESPAWHEEPLTTTRRPAGARRDPPSPGLRRGLAEVRGCEGAPRTKADE
jgi:phosphatidylglycerophosphate synthase